MYASTDKSQMLSLKIVDKQLKPAYMKIQKSAMTHTSVHIGMEEVTTSRVT